MNAEAMAERVEAASHGKLGECAVLPYTTEPSRSLIIDDETRRARPFRSTRSTGARHGLMIAL